MKIRKFYSQLDVLYKPKASKWTVTTSARRLAILKTN